MLLPRGVTRIFLFFCLPSSKPESQAYENLWFSLIYPDTYCRLCFLGLAKYRVVFRSVMRNRGRGSLPSLHPPLQSTQSAKEPKYHCPPRTGQT